MIDSTLKNAKILIVDDQQPNLDVLTGLLDVKGFTNYKTTTDPRQIISLFKEYKPDLLLLDLKMPHLDGFEVMMQLKSLIPANTYFPILVLTADITPESKLKSLNIGASDFLSKPFDMIELDLRINNLLKVRYFQQQLEEQHQILNEARSETNRMTTEYLDILFNQAHAPIIIWDTSWVITHINHAFEKLSGYDWIDVRNKKIDILFPKNKIDSTLELINDTLLGDERPGTIEINILTKDKELKTVLWNPANIIDRKGNHVIATIAQDITKRKRTEDALALLETRYRRLFESAKDGILILDAETGNIIDVNPFLIDLLGYSKEQFIEKEIWELGFFKDIAANKEKFLELQQKEYIRYENLPLESADGRKISVEFVSNVYLVNHRKVIQCNIRDNTRRVHDEEEIIMLASSLKSINECVSITDMKNIIIFVNNSFLKTYGYNENELIGKHISTVVSLHNPIELIGEILPTTLLGEWKGELWNKRKDGSEFLIYLSTTIIHDIGGKPLGLIGVATDITERKFAEQELTKSKELAESASKLKDAFIANMSHEIRTPLNGILGISSIIRDTFRDKMKEEDEELFRGIDLSSKRIIRTVDMILNYSRLQVGEFQIIRKELEISSICENLVKEFMIPAVVKSVELNFHNNCGIVAIFADEYTITMAISNLIDNAVKYTKKGFIELTLRKGINDDIILDIIDTGIGIGDEYIQKMFEPFQQEQMGYGRAYEGIGLGLSLVKKVLDLNNAKITVESKKDEGTKFSINFGKEVLPVKKITEPTKPTTVLPVLEKSGLEMVLIVEDDPLNQITMNRFVNNSYNTMITDSSEGALEILQKNKIDIILMDISIEGKLNGLELTKELKASKEYSHIPIIAVTAHAFEEDKKNAFEAGCDNFLVKPFTRESLLEMIDGYAYK